MPTYPFYQVDAFASRAFEGNQACVMPMAAFLPDATLQSIAAENNVAETAYVVAKGEGAWDLRWFTPAVEVPLCGHATLAAAHVLFSHEGFDGDVIAFETRKSGRLTVRRAGDGYEMDFPAAIVREVPVDDALVQALGARPVAAYAGGFLAAAFETPEDVAALDPDMAKLAKVGIVEGGWGLGNVGCFASGGPDGTDVVSRFFAPGSGIPEDPATGSWHCMLAPVMALRTGQTELACYQAYPGRGARVGTVLDGQRVRLSGTCVTVIEGRFSV